LVLRKLQEKLAREGTNAPGGVFASRNVTDYATVWKRPRHAARQLTVGNQSGPGAFDIGGARKVNVMPAEKTLGIYCSDLSARLENYQRRYFLLSPVGVGFLGVNLDQPIEE